MGDIVTRIIFDDTEAIKSMENLANSIDKVDENFKDIEESGQKAFDGLAKDVKDSAVAMDKYEKSTEDAAQSTKKTSEAVSELGADVNILGVNITSTVSALKSKAAALKAVTAASAGTSKGFKLLRIALISTGIGAIVVALGSLVVFLTKTQKGAELMERAMAAVGAVISVVTERIAKIGEAVTLVFQGKFKEAGKVASEAMKGIKEEIIATIVETDRLTISMQNLRQRFRELRVEQSENRKEIALLKQIYEDTTQSIENRIEAAEKAGEIEKTNIDNQLAALNEQFAIQEKLLKQGGLTEDELETLADLRVEINEKELESIEKQIEIHNSLNTIRAEGIAQAKAAAEEAARILQESVEKARQLLSESLDKMPQLTKETAIKVKAVIDEVDPLADLVSPEPDIPAAISKFKLLAEKLKQFFQSGEANEWVDGINNAVQSVADGLGGIFDAELEQQQAVIDGIKEQNDILEEELDRELGLREDGLANRADLAQRALDEGLEREKLAEEKANELRKKQLNAQLAADTAQQLSGVATAAVNFFTAESKKGLLGVAFAVAAIGAMFATIASVKSRSSALQESFHEGGFIGGDGNPWRSDRYGRGHRVEDSNIVLGGDEFVVNGRTTSKHRGFLEQLNAGYFDNMNLANEMNSGFRKRDNTINQRAAKRNQKMLNIAMAGAMSQHSNSMINYMAKQGQYYSYGPGDTVVHVTPTKIQRSRQ